MVLDQPLLYAPPPDAPAPPVPLFKPLPRLKVMWKGADQSLWDLTSWQDNGIALLKGVEGFGRNETEKHVSSSPALDGDVLHSVRGLERDVFLPIAVYADDPLDFFERDTAFDASFDDERTGNLTVQIPRRVESPAWSVLDRSIDLVLHELDDTYDFDPARRGWARYGYTLRAHRPYWYSRPVTAEWSPSAPVKFFADDGSSFHVSDSGSSGTVIWTNIGDVPSWAQLTFRGPFTTVKLAINGQQTVFPFTLGDGEVAFFDTAPDKRVLWKGPLNITSLLPNTVCLPIPRGQVTVTVEITGAGKVQMQFTPLYKRAW